MIMIIIRYINRFIYKYITIPIYKIWHDFDGPPWSQRPPGAVSRCSWAVCFPVVLVRTGMDNK